MDARSLIATLTPERARFLAMARRRVASPADAEDVLQRAFLRAADRADALHDPERARAWFYRILRHAIADHHRARTLGTAPGDHVADIDQIADERTCGPTPNPCTCALRLLAEMRPAYEEVLRRIDLDSEDPATVAAALGISVSHLHVRLHRARRALQSRVREHCCVASARPCLDCSCDQQTRCGSSASG